MLSVKQYEHVKEWLSSIGIEVRTEFGLASEHQPLVLSNNPHAHAAIYFSDPDGNSLELITPLRLDDVESFNEMSLEEGENVNPSNLIIHEDKL
ncbi:hypothetical protein [Lysinibacillus sp. NPDC096212]|uniref:hypothetical protein n=1 Tax=Lysinibacillus sp. NPDC096212 TaxID=3364135 RepID=UPI00381A7562